MRYGLGLAALHLIGCHGGAPLITTQNLPANEDCPEGGILILNGLDADKDGQLSADEIQSSATICHGEDGEDGQDGVDGQNGNDGENGADGEDGADGQDGISPESPSLLLETQDEGPSEACPNGGVQVNSGFDSNENGQLDGDEIEESIILCHGQDASTQYALVDIQDEPPGTQCSAGGWVIHTGLDLNGNQELEADEITESDYLCHSEGEEPSLVTELQGNYYIHNSYDAALLEGVIHLSGTLFIDGIEAVDGITLTTLESLSGLVIAESDGLAQFDAPNLQSINGALRIENNGDLYQLNLPELREVGGAFTLNQNGQLPNLALSSLSTLSGELTVSENSALGALQLPELQEIEGDFTLAELPNLQSLSLPKLTHVENLNLGPLGLGSLSAFTALESIENLEMTCGENQSGLNLPALQTAAEISIHHCPTLAVLSFGKLTTLNTGLSLIDLPNLASFSSPDLVTALALQIEGSGLLSLDLESIQNFSNLSVVDNPLLTELILPDRGHAQAHLTVESNPELATIRGLNDATQLGNLTLNTLPRLYLMPAFENIATLSDSLTLINLERFNDWSAFSSFTQTQDLHLEALDDLANLTSFSNITVTGGLELRANPNLTTLSGLTKVGDLTGDLILFANGELHDISTLYRVDSVGGNFWVSQNPELAQCDVDALIEAIGDENIAGNVTTSNNSDEPCLD